MLEREQSARGPQSEHLKWFSSAAPEGSVSARRDDHVPEIPVSHRNLNLRGRGALVVTLRPFRRARARRAWVRRLVTPSPAGPEPSPPFPAPSAPPPRRALPRSSPS